MSTKPLPPLIAPEDLQHHQEDPALLIVYCGRIEHYLSAHIPGAVRLDSGSLKLGLPPAAGLLPDAASLEWVFSQLGLQREQQVICYDDAGGTEAGRLFWTLEAMGHKTVSFLDGGFKSWIGCALPVSNETRLLNPTHWRARPDSNVTADKQYVLGSLKDSSIQILDARSREEYDGIRSASERRGHIPGALHLDWLDTLDVNNDNRLKAPEILENMLTVRGVSREHEIIVHCQTHMRSSHTFMVLRSLGYERVRGYAGSWSEWAADLAMPTE